MSTYSSTTNELFYLTVRTEYGDDAFGCGRIWRTRMLAWRAFGWEGTIDIGSRTHPKFKTSAKTWLWYFRTELRYFRYRFTAQHFPFEKEESELARMYRWEKKVKTSSK